METLVRRSVRLICCLGIIGLMVGEDVWAAAPTSLSTGWTMAAMPAQQSAALRQAGAPYSKQGGEPTYLLTTRHGLVAFGVATANCCPPQLLPTEWLSQDGGKWQQIAIDPTVFGRKSINAIAAGKSGLVAVGSRSEATPGSPLYPAAWFSPDGRVWQRATASGNSFRLGEMRAVTAAGNGFVAVGDMASPGDELSPPSNLMAVWLSTDGRRWQLVSDASPAFQNATAEAVARDKNGFVAIGVSHDPQSNAAQTTIVWTSRDARAWQRVPQAAGVFLNGREVQFRGLVAGYSRDVAWGSSFSDVPQQIVWTSPDGAHWQRAPGIHFQYGLVSSIIPHGQGFIALGVRDNEPTLWSSPDGVHWASAAGQDVFGGADTQLGSAADVPGGIVVVGSANRPIPFGYGVVYSRGPVYTPSAWTWRPGRRNQPHPQWPKGDPKWFRLRIEDLPAGFQVPVFGQNRYSLGCDDVPNPSRTDPCLKAMAALGPTVPFYFRFPYGAMAYSNSQNAPYVGGFAILTQSPARAKAAFQYAAGLVHAVDLNLNRAPARPVRSLRIGQGAELLSQKIMSPCPAAPPQCPPFSQGGTAYAVVWWDGRALGVIEVVGAPKGNPLDRQSLAITLARRQWAHRHALGL